jgi:hypothetical protein
MILNFQNLVNRKLKQMFKFKILTIYVILKKKNKIIKNYKIKLTKI